MISNDYKKCIARVVYDDLKVKMKCTAFVSIVLNEIIFAINYSQMFAIIRHVNYKSKTKESFIIFSDASAE